MKKQNTKFTQRISARYGGLLLLVLVFCVQAFGGVTHASVQGYVPSDGQPIKKGLVVGLATEATPKSGSASNSAVTVERSSIAHPEKTVGVVVEMASDPVVVSDPGSKLYVANSGVAIVFVTDVNGEVHSGDLLAPSPIRGVLMRASEGTKGILGVATEDFPTQGGEAVKLTNNGANVEARVAPVVINMDVKFVTATAGSGKSSLQRAGESFVGREVSTLQVLIALSILVLIVLVEGGIIYAMVSSTILSVGRNPFARKAIMRTMFQVILLCIGVLALGVLAIYLVLWI